MSLHRCSRRAQRKPPAPHFRLMQRHRAPIVISTDRRSEGTHTYRQQLLYWYTTSSGCRQTKDTKNIIQIKISIYIIFQQKKRHATTAWKGRKKYQLWSIALSKKYIPLTASSSKGVEIHELLQKSKLFSFGHDVCVAIFKRLLVTTQRTVCSSNMNTTCGSKNRYHTFSPLSTNCVHVCVLVVLRGFEIRTNTFRGGKRGRDIVGTISTNRFVN